MKRDYKFSSILIIYFIVGLTGILLTSLFQKPASEYVIVKLLLNLFLSVFSFIFSFAVAGGLLRNRMGSVGDYLNQINYINPRVITVGFVLSVITGVFNFLLSISGGISLLSAIANPLNSSVFTIGAFLLPIILLLIIILLSIFLSYQDFYLADNYDSQESVANSILNILKIGKELFVKTIAIYLKYYLLPFIIYIVLILFTLAVGKAEIGAFILIIIFTLIFAIIFVILMVVMKARLSDVYLDYKEKEFEEEI